MQRFLFLIVILFFAAIKLLAKENSDTLFVNSMAIEKRVLEGNFNVHFGNNSNYLWRFKPSDNPAYKEKEFNDSSWKRRVSTFDENEVKEEKVGKGIVWFRIRLVADTSMLGESLAFDFQGVGSMEVYLDGHLKRKIGKFKIESEKSYIELRTLPVFLTLDDTLPHLLAVRYEYDDAKKNEDKWGYELTVSTAHNYFATYSNSIRIVSWFLIGLATIFITLSAVHLLMFLYYRKEHSNLYFSLFTLSLGVLLCLAYIVYSSATPIMNYKSSTVLLALCVILSSTSLSAFTASLFSRRKIFLKVILTLGVFTLIITVIDLNVDSDITSFLIGISLLLSIGYAFVMIIIAMIKRLPGALILGSGITFFFIFWLSVGVWLALASSVSFNDVMGFLALFSLVSIPLSISAFLAWRFANTSRNLTKELKNVEMLSIEKQTMLENQKAELEKEVIIRTKEIAEEKKRSDDLLLNILPSEVAEELKLNGKSEAHRYDEVSVLFTDFVNFTKISEQLGVEELLNELNINFTAFDQIMEKYGMEKIKTIGDAYLAVCGLPITNARHAHQTVSAAMEILEFVQKRKREVPYGLDIRIGINSGSLIAGIIGVKKFAYDIWGDTVNTAARMEQSSEPGKINISQSTYLLIKDQFECSYRGKVDAKGKGEMDMYFVESKK